MLLQVAGLLEAAGAVAAGVRPVDAAHVAQEVVVHHVLHRLLDEACGRARRDDDAKTMQRQREDEAKITRR